MSGVIAGCGFGERRDVLILVRADDPVSRAIADYYATARKIPSDRILELSLSDASSADGGGIRQEIDRQEIDAEAFELEIAVPIERYLEQHDPGGEIAILVTTRGLPLRIGHCDVAGEHYLRDCRAAGLDAALSTLGRLPPGTGPLADRANPFFRDPRSFERFRRDEPEAELRFLVARLTGPATPVAPDSGLPQAVEKLIERGSASLEEGPTRPRSEADAKAMGTTAAGPLWRIISQAGREARSAATSALLDPIAQQLPRWGHRICDGCGRPQADERPAGIVLQTANAPDATDARDATNTTDTTDTTDTTETTDTTKATNTTDATDRAVPTALPQELAFPGIVIGLMSNDLAGTGEVDATDSAVQSGAGGFDRFVATWIERGAGAISTHLADPSLAGVTRPTAQLEAWAAGRIAVEAHFQSVPQLGWMNVFVGDPLLVLTDAPAATTDDRDGDGISDANDNCRDEPNPAQRDSNGDGVGNRCDADVDDDGRVLTSWGRIYPVDARGDLEAIALSARNGPHNPDHDLDGDGRVDERDLVLAQLWLFRTPGPSGTVAD